jgi:hypothetical protein
MIRKLKPLYAAAFLAGSLALTGCGGAGTGSNPTISGVNGPTVNFVNGTVVVSMVFDNISIDGGATVPIPKYPNSTFEVGPDFQSGGMLVSLTVSATDFLGNQGAGLNPQTLPGGRPLPGVAAGALPAIAVAIPKLDNAVLYLGPSVIGVFIPFKQLNIAGTIATFRFYNSAKAAVGNISIVGSDANGANAGLLMMMDPALLGIKGLKAQKAAYEKYIKAGYR